MSADREGGIEPVRVGQVAAQQRPHDHRARNHELIQRSRVGARLRRGQFEEKIEAGQVESRPEDAGRDVDEDHLPRRRHEDPEQWENRDRQGARR